MKMLLMDPVWYLSVVFDHHSSIALFFSSRQTEINIFLNEIVNSEAGARW
jgi:hypothetical protein